MLTNKPPSVSVKDWLISHTAKELEADEALCEQVVSWVYLKAREAAPSNNSIELSGFGKLIISPGKAKRKLIKLKGRLERCREWLAEAKTEEEIAEWTNKHATALTNYNNLKKRIEDAFGLEGYIDGLAE